MELPKNTGRYTAKGIIPVSSMLHSLLAQGYSA